jgi:uncharacterized protein
MNALLQEKHDGIASLCQRYHVEQLDVFGSATSDSFDPRRSDLDFLVVFAPCTPTEHYERYFSLVEDLEGLFGRPVDLVEAPAIRNPYFLRSVNETRTTLYAA